MTFIEIAVPTKFERVMVMFAQGIFYISYFILYLISYKTAHRLVGYLEEEAVVSYTRYLECIEEGEVENVKAPQIAINYWQLADDAKLSDVIIAVRADEMKHREVNHCIANKISGKKCKIDLPKEVLKNDETDLNSYEKRKAP